MTFPIRESSRTLGEPVNLYFIVYGDTPASYYAYTDSEQEVHLNFDAALGEVIFKPIPITHGNITASGSLDKSAVEMRTPQSAELAQLFTLHPPSQIIRLTIFQAHDGDGDYRVEWVGRILGSSREVNEAVYTCEPVSTSMKRPGLRRNYQYQCPHVLYGPQCKADRGRATILRSVTGVAGALVSLPPGWDANPDRFNGGLAEWLTADGRTELRTIQKRADANTLILSGIAAGLVPGAQIKLSWGCKHDTPDCRDLHANVLNFGGQPWIPLKNPLGIKNNFY